MARSIHADTIAEVLKQDVIPFLMVLLETGGGDVAAWSGIGDYVSSVSGSSKTYSGTGHLLKISPIVETQDLSARGLTISLSGIPSAIISVALNDLEQGLPVRVFMGFFAQSTRVSINNEFEIFNGITDVPVIDEGADTSTVSISVENRLIDLEKVRVRRYTPEDQARDNITDLGFEFVPALQDAEILFGASR